MQVKWNVFEDIDFCLFQRCEMRQAFCVCSVEAVQCHHAICCSFSVCTLSHWCCIRVGPCNTVCLPFHVQPSSCNFLILEISLRSQPGSSMHASLQNTFCCECVSGSRRHMRHDSYSNLSLLFHILSRLEPGCAHRCGELLCSRSHWKSSAPLSTVFNPPSHTHKCSISGLLCNVFQGNQKYKLLLVVKNCSWTSAFCADVLHMKTLTK